MKLRHLKVENFKGIRELEIDFRPSPGAFPRPLTCLLGDNGSGKTTVLQAIAYSLGVITKKVRRVDQFDWPGFDRHRLGTHGPTRVEMSLEVPGKVIQTWSALPASGVMSHLALPDSTRDYIVTLDHRARGTELRGPQDLIGWLTHLWATPVGNGPGKAVIVPQVLWFDQFRSLGTAGGGKQRGGWQGGVERLRESLVGWWGHHRSEGAQGGRNFLAELERTLDQVFPGIRFAGIQPKDADQVGGAADFYVLLERDGITFDIGEMSSGEQAVFALAYEFVRQRVSHSIVLIDELELHLHPPQQQALLAALPMLGKECQFVITTHSPYLEGAIPDEHEVRLKGGRLCL